MKNINSFNSEHLIEINNKKFKYFDLSKVAKQFDINLNNPLPFGWGYFCQTNNYL